MALINITQLKILLVEHNQTSRASLIKQLRALGIGQIHGFSNGTELLAKVAELQADLIIFGFDLGDALRGTDLLRYMIRRNILPTWIPVAFVTEHAEQVLADLPLRILPTPVISRPLSDAKLLTLLKQSALLINTTRPLLEGCYGEYCTLPASAILNTSTEKLPASVKDVVLTLKIMSLVQSNQAAQARNFALQISNEQRRFEWLLNLVYILGDAEELLKLQQQLQHAQLLPKKRLLYQMRMLQQRQQLKSMLALCESMHESLRTPNEINLKAILLFVLQGYDAADQYLSAKAPSRQDPYAVNLLLFWRTALTLLQSLQQPDASHLKTRLVQFSGQLRWDKGAVDFARFSELTQLAIKAMDSQSDVSDTLTRLQLRADDFDVFQCLMLAFLAIKMAHPSASLWLFSADSQLAQMHIYAERLSAGIIHAYLFEHIFVQPDARSAVYNHWGRKYVHLKHHYRALSMFYKAWRCSPDTPRYPLNLLHSMQGLGLEQFWDCNKQQLQQQLQSRVLTDKEKSSLSKLDQSLR